MKYEDGTVIYRNVEGEIVCVMYNDGTVEGDKTTAISKHIANGYEQLDEYKTSYPNE